LLDVYYDNIIKDENEEEKTIREIYENFETFFNSDLIAIKLMRKCICSKRFGYCKKLVDRVFGIKKFTSITFFELCRLLTFNEESGNLFYDKYHKVCEIYDFFEYKNLISIEEYEFLAVYFMCTSNKEISYKFLHLAICKGTQNKCIQLKYGGYLIGKNGGIDIFINVPIKEERISDGNFTCAKPYFAFGQTSYSGNGFWDNFFKVHV
jgi:hypothetical protein